MKSIRKYFVKDVFDEIRKFEFTKANPLWIVMVVAIDAKLVNSNKVSAEPVEGSYEAVETLVNICESVMRFGTPTAPARTWVIAIRKDGVDCGETLEEVMNMCEANGRPVRLYEFKIAKGNVRARRILAE